ncbi:hypothetical protein [Photobacterium sp. 1_MG-2023]|uniref:hypothetical protein n=1 Tax=Photobacterium sp. 1_MG-2023 TaxID=3062646 RepID=UPI0026E1AA68|nr:hypothetical protein [Photobacterium sp. 1_MG-2023]MDO6705413.1 hypothetical protein [Photobacterium sp. 1_MG-2023]
MFKKKLSVVMLASLGLFGCDWNDDDKKAVEEAVKDNVTEEVVKPEGLNVQVDFYNELPLPLNDQQKFKVGFAFDIDNSGKIEEENDLIVQAIFSNEEPRIVVGDSEHLSDINVPGTRYVVADVGSAELKIVDGKSVVAINILPEPKLIESVNSEPGILESTDPMFAKYTQLLKSVNNQTPVSAFVDYNTSSEPGVESFDSITESVDIMYQGDNSDIFDAKDDYEGIENYADIKRVSFSFN